MKLIFKKIKTGDLTVAYEEVLDITTLIGRVSIQKKSLLRLFGEIPDVLQMEVTDAECKDADVDKSVKQHYLSGAKTGKRKKTDKKADSYRGKKKVQSR